MALPQSLCDRWSKALQAAREYHAAGGNPVEDLNALLSETVHDQATWQDILDSPYLPYDAYPPTLPGKRAE